MSKYAEEMVALNLGKRYGLPTVALRYSIVQGPRQSVYNAYSGACRIFNLHYLLGGAPTLYEDGQAIRDYVNIHDVVDANVLVLTDERAPGHVFNVGGGTPTRPRSSRTSSGSTTAPTCPRGSPASTGSATPATSSPTSTRCKQLGWAPLRTPADSVAEYAGLARGMPGLDDVLAAADAQMRELGVVRKAGA